MTAKQFCFQCSGPGRSESPLLPANHWAGTLKLGFGFCCTYLMSINSNYLDSINKACSDKHFGHLCGLNSAGDNTLGKGQTIQQAHMWGKQGETRGDTGRQGETKGDKGRQRETRGDKGRLGKAATPSNTGTHLGRQETMENKRRQRERRPSGRRPRHPTQAHMWGDKGRQGETRK